MTIYYSPKNKGFYDTGEVNYPNLPDDLIEITKEQHVQFIHAINMEGKELVLADGALTLQDLVRVPTWWEIRLTRNRLLAMSDFTQMPDYPGDKEAWATYRQTLRDIPQTHTNPENVIWPTAPGE